MKHSPKEKMDSSRRSFFRSFLSETIAFAEEAKGKPQMAINDLDKVPVQIFEEIIPTCYSHSDYRIEENRLLWLDRKTGQPELIHTFDQTEMSIIRRFDGTRTIRRVADELSAESGEDRQDCFRQVRLIFILLAKRMVFLPSSAHTR